MARVANATVLTTATLNQDVAVGGTEWLTVIAIVGTAAAAAGAAGDVSVSVLPYLDDQVAGTGPSLVPTTLALPTTESVAAVLAASRAYVFIRVRVAGLSRVQIQAKNNNAATKPVEINFGLG